LISEPQRGGGVEAVKRAAAPHDAAATELGAPPSESTLTAAPLSSEDVAHAYAIFLGKAAPPVTAPPPGTSLAQLLTSIFSSDEFRRQVLEPVMLREGTGLDRHEGTPSLRQIDWAQTRLPLEAGTRTTCGTLGSWPALLELLLADGRLIQLAPGFTEAGIDRVLRERVARDPQYRNRRQVIGAIDAASAYEIRGWAVDLCNKAATVTLEVYADSVFLGAARCDQPRPDVAEVVGGNGQVGFNFKIAATHRAGFGGGVQLTVVDSVSRKPIGAAITVQSDSAHQLDGLAAARREIGQLRKALERIEEQLPDLSRSASLPLEAYEEYWQRFYRPSPEHLARQRAEAATFAYRPLVSVLVPAFQSDARLLDLAIASVIRQSYSNWELIVSDDASPDPSTVEMLRRRHGSEPRVRWLTAARRGGIAENTNRALDAARGEYIAFLDHDDELAPDALYCVVAALQQQRYTLLYTDEDRIEEDDYGQCVHHTPFFKPDFDPDLLLAMNYICHLVVAERGALRSIAGLRRGFDGAQDHDLLLRLTARSAPERIVHLPRVLYHWRVTPGSVSMTPERQEPLRRAIVAVVDAHLQEHCLDAAAEPHSDPYGRPRLFANRVRWRLPARPPKVSILIPTRDRLDLLEPCVASVLESAPNYPGAIEILLIDNDSAEAATRAYFERIAVNPRVRVLAYRGAFNWSAINNEAARQADGEALIFLNNDTVVLSPDWCTELVSHVMRADVGVAGARLLYRDGTIQHAGVLLGVEGVAGHEAVAEPPLAGGYFGRTHLLHSAAAVTGACLATRRSLFLELGGFDELLLKVAFNDVDFCMRVRQRGMRIVYTPYATLYHYESKSRGRELTAEQQARHRSEARAFRARWGQNIADPYYNPHFERYARPFDRLRPPPQ
jgi:GT2 family glycosyltransferase